MRRLSRFGLALCTAGVFACPPSSSSSPHAPPALEQSKAVPPQQSAQASPFAEIDLPVGLPRERAEQAIATALGNAEATYSPYGNNLRGGTVEYTDATGKFVLDVTYQAGVPAPWVTRPDGVAEHHPPVDESVISFRSYRK